MLLSLLKNRRFFRNYKEGAPSCWQRNKVGRELEPSPRKKADGLHSKGIYIINGEKRIVKGK